MLTWFSMLFRAVLIMTGFLFAGHLSRNAFARLIVRYQLESAVPVLADRASVEELGTRMIEEPLACVNNGVIRHDHTVLARTVLRQALGKR